MTNTNEPSVDWSFEFTDDNDLSDPDHLYRLKDPAYLHVDPMDE